MGKRQLAVLRFTAPTKAEDPSGLTKAESDSAKQTVAVGGSGRQGSVGLLMASAAQERALWAFAESAAPHLGDGEPFGKGSRIG